jgi:UDP-glucose 4-epimerase
VARANVLALESMETTGIFNVGMSVETTVNELFSEINSQFDNKFREMHAPAKLGEQKTSSLDYGKIQEVMGWSPKTGLKEGIARTYRWFEGKGK